ncbi:hypothetical protein C8R47DRAFT_1201963 [Mycena vitilis]|nr:hypothetical protein C8R47DRAFT_1201963 [Mycena vitilis]
MPPTRRTVAEQCRVIVKKDPIFYRDDGDCFVQVEDYLFKIHKDIAHADRLHEMLKATATAEATPIMLTGDKLSQFRAFLSLVYTDLSQRYCSLDDLQTLIDSGWFSQKYELDYWRQVSVKLVHQVCGAYHLHSLPLDLYMKILELVDSQPFKVDAGHLGHIRRTVQAAWARALGPDQPTKRIREAMLFAEHHNYRELLGRAYHSYLIRIEQSAQLSQTGTVLLNIVSSFGAVHINDNIPMEHTLRLLNGYWSLSQLWRQLSSAAPHYRAGPRCTAIEHTKSCEVEWKHAWCTAAISSSVTSKAPSDILGKLQALHVEMKPTYLRMLSLCGSDAAEAAPRLAEQIMASLPDHFLGPGSSYLPVLVPSRFESLV